MKDAVGQPIKTEDLVVYIDNTFQHMQLGQVDKPTEKGAYLIPFEEGDWEPVHFISKDFVRFGTQYASFLENHPELMI